MQRTPTPDPVHVVAFIGTGLMGVPVHRLLVASNLVAIAGALTLAAENGLDPRILPDALTGGFADSIPLQHVARSRTGVASPSRNPQ